LRNCDVIIVFGAAVHKGGAPSDALKRRLNQGVRLFKAGLSSRMILTGGVGAYPPAEALLMRNLATEQGVPLSAITVEARSSSTFESAKRCSAIMARQNWRTALVVSDSYHVLRAVMMLSYLGITAVNGGTDEGKRVNSRPRWIYYHLRECVAIMWFLVSNGLRKFSRWSERPAPDP